MDKITNIFKFIAGSLIGGLIVGMLFVMNIIFMDENYNDEDGTYSEMLCMEISEHCYEEERDCCVDYQFEEIPVIVKIIDDFKLGFIIGIFGLGIIIGLSFIENKKKI